MPLDPNDVPDWLKEASEDVVVPEDEVVSIGPDAELEQITEIVEEQEQEAEVEASEEEELPRCPFFINMDEVEWLDYYMGEK